MSTLIPARITASDLTQRELDTLNFARSEGHVSPDCRVGRYGARRAGSPAIASLVSKGLLERSPRLGFPKTNHRLTDAGSTLIARLYAEGRV
jgi:DNA-binding MarR family transcriptional regulator